MAMRSTYVRTPRARVPWRSLLWICVVFFGVGCLGFWMLGRLQNAPMPRSANLTGSLSRIAAPVPVIAPKHTLISQLLVAEGDIVRAGQTLAVVDADQLNLIRDRLAQKRLVGQLRRECFLGWAAEGKRPANLPELADVDLLAELRLAQAECLNRAISLQQNISTAEQHVDLLQDRKRILSQYQTLMIGAPRQQTNTQNALRILRIMLAKSGLEEQLQDAETALSTMKSEMRATLLELANQENDQIQRLAAELAQLELLIKTPRLQSPLGGTVHRLREPPTGAGLLSAETLFEILPRENQGFQVSVDIPSTLVDAVSIGDMIDFTIAGFGRDGIGYRGVLNGLPHAQNNGMLRVSVLPDPDSEARLVRLQDRIALGLDNTASVLGVRLAPAKMDDLLLSQWRNHMPAFPWSRCCTNLFEGMRGG